MSEVKAEKRKPEYSTIENSIYILKNVWRWDKILFLLGFLQIPATVIIPLLGIYLPKIVIDSATNHVSVSRLMINVSIPVIGIIALNVLLNASSSITNFRAISGRIAYMKQISDKTMDMDFDNFDSPSGQVKFTKANMTTNTEVMLPL